MYKMKKDKMITLRIPKILMDEIDKYIKKKEITKSRLIIESLCDKVGLRYVPEQVVKHKWNQRGER